VQCESIVKPGHTEFWSPLFQFAPGDWQAKMGVVIIKATLLEGATELVKPSTEGG